MALSSVFVVSNSLRLRRFKTAYPADRTPKPGRKSAKAANATATQPSPPITAAAPGTGLAQLAAIAARLESAVGALAQLQGGAANPLHHNGNGQGAGLPVPAPQEQIDELQRLRAQIDAQLSRLQDP